MLESKADARTIKVSKLVKNEIHLESPAIMRSYTIEHKAEIYGKVKKFFNADTFFAQYTTSIEQVPASLLAVPLLANLAPVAWVSGAKLFVREIDKVFLESLAAIKNHLACYYPGLPLEGEIFAERVVDNSASGRAGYRKALLFSGGVDSTASLLRKQDENPLIITVNGADIKVSWTDAWEKVSRTAIDIGATFRLTNAFITSNFRSVVDEKMLDLYFKSHVSNWWEGIQSGMGILGLCAPVTHMEQVNHLYMATCQPNAGWPWDAHIGINNNTKWAQTMVDYEGGQLTRQQKIGLIAEFVRRNGPQFPLRVCYISPKGDNCGLCKKCAVTAIGLLLEGIEPRMLSLPFGVAELATVRSKLEKREWSLLPSISLWKEIQNTIPEKLHIMVPYSRDFFSWLQTVDIQTVVTPKALPFKENTRDFRRKYIKRPIYCLEKILRG